MSKEFKREERYIVVKIKDAQAVRSTTESGEQAINRLLNAWQIPNREALVIEKDWPEFEPAWAMIERRMTGTPEWNGEGLPPVGAVCEYIGGKHKLEIGAQVEIVHHFHAGAADVAAFIYSAGAGLGRHVAQSIAENFRPIRTPEQIAADERREAVAEMADIARMATGMICNLADFQALYDAGYRKQVAP